MDAFELLASVRAAVSFATFATAATANDAKLRAYGSAWHPSARAAIGLTALKTVFPGSAVGRPRISYGSSRTARDGGRTDPEMVSAVRGLNESQLQALARYFGSLKTAVRLR